MIGGEALDQRGRVFPFAVHEHMRVRHEHIFEHDQRLLAGELRVAGIHRAAIDHAGVVGLAADDVCEAGRVDTDRANHRPVAVLLGHAHGRHENEPVRIDRAGLVHLGAGDVDAFLVALRDMKEEIDVGFCWCGALERSPFGSVIAPPITTFAACARFKKARKRLW